MTAADIERRHTVWWSTIWRALNKELTAAEIMQLLDLLDNSLTDFLHPPVPSAPPSARQGSRGLAFDEMPKPSAAQRVAIVLCHYFAGRFPAGRNCELEAAIEAVVAPLEEFIPREEMEETINLGIWDADIGAAYQHHQEEWRKAHNGAYPSRADTYASFGGRLTHDRIAGLRQVYVPPDIKKGGRPRKHPSK